MTDRWKHWTADTAERVLSTTAQAALAAIAVTGWSEQTLHVAVAAAGLSLLKCVAALSIGASDSASLLPAEPPQEDDSA